MKTFRQILIGVILILAIIVSIFLKIAPYLIYKYDFLIGFDSGKYTYDLVNKTSTSPDKLDLWVEPGFNTTMSALNAFINIDEKYLFMYYLPVVISIYFLGMTFLITKRITKNDFAGLYTACYLATSTVFLNSTFDSFYRQIFSTAILLSFLYVFERFYHNHILPARIAVLLGVLGAGIIFSHRAISLLFIILLGIIALPILFTKKFKSLLPLISTFMIAITLSFPYWISIAITNVIILKDAIVLSAEKKTGGERIIKSLNRNDNQLTGYILNITFSFLSAIGLGYLFSVNRKSLVTVLTAFLIIYIYIKATFSSRFIFNLDILFAMCAGVALVYFMRHLRRTSVLLIALLILSLNFINSLDIALNRVPYIPYTTESTKWVENHISKKDAIIFAPDALSTILTSRGFRTSVYELPEEGKDSRIFNTEYFLTDGYKDPKRLHNKLKNFKEVYIIFNAWHITNPFARTGNVIPLEKWDSSKFVSREYIGDPYITRVYKVK